MRFNLVRFVNGVILSSIAVLAVTGVYGLFWTLHGWIFDAHRIAGWLLIATIPWKTAISLRSLRRGIGLNFDRGVVVLVSVLLGGVTLLVIGLGLVWAWRLGPQWLWLSQTAISWHWMLGLGLLVPFALHAWRRWPRPQRADFLSRRAALKALSLGAATLASWWAGGTLAKWRALSEAPRRFTGSRREGYFSGNQFPVTHTVAARKEDLDLDIWRLRLTGGVVSPGEYTYERLIEWRAQKMVADLDCTLGWYTTQRWKGVFLKELLEQAVLVEKVFAVRLESVTGFAQILPIVEAEQVLLATHVGDEILTYEHGFPIRAVVPTRRGWFWVKWLKRIEVISLEG